MDRCEGWADDVAEFLQMSDSGGFVVWLVAAALAAWIACVAASLQQEEFVFAAFVQQEESLFAAFCSRGSCVLAALLLGRLLAALQLQGVLRCLAAFRDVLVGCIQP